MLNQLSRFFRNTGMSNKCHYDYVLTKLGDSVLAIGQWVSSWRNAYWCIFTVKLVQRFAASVVVIHVACSELRLTLAVVSLVGHVLSTHRPADWLTLHDPGEPLAFRTPKSFLTVFFPKLLQCGFRTVVETVILFFTDWWYVKSLHVRGFFIHRSFSS